MLKNAKENLKFMPGKLFTRKRTAAVREERTQRDGSL